MRYLIYARVSTDKQDTATQIRLAKERLEVLHPDAKYDYMIFDEGDLSSQKAYMKRPQLQAMLNTVKAGDVVIVYMLDRLARDTIEMVTAWRHVNKNNATVLSLCGEDTSELVITIMGAIAQDQRRLIQLKTKDKLETKRKKGERYSRFLPYGYAMHETKLVPIRDGDQIVMKRGILVPLYEEQQVIKIMKQLSEEGLGYQEIANELSRQGFRNREGNEFHKMSVYRILKKVTATCEDQPLEESDAVLAHQQ